VPAFKPDPALTPADEDLLKQYADRCALHAAAVVGIPLSILASRQRSRGLASARAVVAAYLGDCAGLSTAQIARVFGRHGTQTAAGWIRRGRRLTRESAVAAERAALLREQHGGAVPKADEVGR
jgi:nicotinic acid phosphoribosyltransferase